VGILIDFLDCFLLVNRRLDEAFLDSSRNLAGFFISSIERVISLILVFMSSRVLTALL